MSSGHHGVIDAALAAIVSAAVEERLRPMKEQLHALEARLAELVPNEDGLTYKQAAAALSVSAKTIGRWVNSNKIAAGGTPRSPRIARSEVRRLLQGHGVDQNRRPSAAEDLDLVTLARGMISAGSKGAGRV